MQETDPARATSRQHLVRFAWLLACIVVGLIIAAIGSALSDSSVWYLAVPAMVAIGWLFLADPTACEASPQKPDRRAPRQ